MCVCSVLTNRSVNMPKCAIHFDFVTLYEECQSTSAMRTYVCFNMINIIRRSVAPSSHIISGISLIIFSQLRFCFRTRYKYMMGHVPWRIYFSIRVSCVCIASMSAAVPRGHPVSNANLHGFCCFSHIFFYCVLLMF